MKDEPHPADARVRTNTFDDMDRQAAELAGFDQSYRQMSKGRFAGTFSSITLSAQEGIHVERVNQVIDQAAAVPLGQVAAIFLLSGQALCKLGSLDFSFEDLALFGPGAEIQFRNALDTAVCVVSLSLDRLVDRWPGADRRLKRGESLLLRPGSGRMPSIAATVSGVLATASHHSPRSLSVVQDKICDGLKQEFRGIRSADRLGDPRLAPPLRRIFDRARKTIEADLATDWSVANLAAEVGVSRRILEYAFQDAIGFGPSHYIQRLRLNAVRAILVNEPQVTIGDATARYGIWHLSRFAVQYRELFGELPSETVRRSRR